MRRYSMLAAAAAGVFLVGASSAGAAPDVRPRAAAVTGVSVIPGAGRAEVVLAIEGTAEITDFTLDGPHRIVVDLKGATMRLRAPAYDRVSRAGIQNVRVAQYQADVVRLVLDLDAAREYSVVRSETELRISVIGPDGFQPWSAGANAVRANAPVMAEAAPAPAPFAAPVEPVVHNRLPRVSKEQAAPQSQEPRVYWSFVNEDIRNVIAAFSNFSGRTFITGSSVSGTVTAEIPGQPWDVALSKILQAYGLSAQEDSTGIITIDSYRNVQARIAAEPLVTQLVPVNYAKATELALSIRQIMSACSSGSTTGASVTDVAAPADAAAPVDAGGVAPTPQNCGRGSVAVDANTNTLIITESVSRLPELVSYVRDLDVRTPQVAIKAKIISIDRTGTEQLGLSYDFREFGTGFSCIARLVPCINPTTGAVTDADIVVELGGDSYFGVANANRQFSATGALNLMFGAVMGNFQLTSFLDALSSQQLSDVQAEPSTTTVDNRKATLFAGSTIAYLLTPPPVPGAITEAQATIARQEIGITLEVTPHVTANRQISMDISATQQSLISITVAGPTINERRSANQVLVADGETAVIAGLTQTQVTTSKSGIPFLMKLPFIGRFFSQTSNEERKQDLLILVTPHIIDEGEVVRSVRP
jgi:type IV pilus assembly protein PilQ